jgi:hypothetical protein
VIPRVRIVERAEDGVRKDLQLEVQRRPNAMLFKRPERTTLSARLCPACGYTELYADAPDVLYNAFLQADTGPAASPLEELERTREALADSQIKLRELEDKLRFVEQLVGGEKAMPRALTEGNPDGHD